MVEHTTETKTPSRSPLSQLAAERTAALVVAALGAGLLVAAAGTFIAVSWDRLGLEAKAGLVALIALLALGAGRLLSSRSPGTAIVLTHLGGFLIPIDVGGVATAVGLERAEVGVVAGTIGAVVLTALDRTRSPFMALGRVLSLGAAGLGVAALMNIPPSVVFVAAAAAMLAVRAISPSLYRRHWLDGVGMAFLAGSGPALALAAVATRSGSLIDWLAELTAANPSTIVVVAALAAIISLVIDRGLVGLSVAAAVVALATPSAVELIADHQTSALIMTGAAVLAGRVALLTKEGLTRFVPWLDAAGLAVGVIAGLVAAANIEPDASLAVGALATSALLIASWLLSDLEGGARLGCRGAYWTRIVRGDSGPVSTVGLLVSTLGASIALADSDQAALVVAIAAAVVGISSRPGAVLITRVGLLTATMVAFGNPYLALFIGSAAALILQGRAIIDLGRGIGPRIARSTQLFGLSSLALAVLRFAGSSGQTHVYWEVGASLLVAAVIALLAVSSDRLSVPDLRLPPRLLTPLALLPLLDHPEAVGLISLGFASLLFLDRLLNNMSGSDVIASGHLLFGSWILAGVQEVTAIEAYLAAPTLVLLWFGVRATAAGTSSWVGIAPAVALLGSSALLERLVSDDGWHAALAGTIGLVALAVGVERRWSGPTAVGAGLLLTTVTIEGSAVIPQLPVWVLLSLAGLVLLSTGFMLERRAGTGATASIRSAWQLFG